MTITGLIWLEDIVEKLLQKHHVHQYEVWEIFEGEPRILFVENGHRKDEDVYSAFGQTEAGRYLIVFFIYTKEREALILSARDMTDGERKRYG